MQIEQQDHHNFIYYVLPSQKVNLASVSSKRINADQIEHDLSIQGTVNSLKYRHGLNFLGKDYSQLKVPCTPAKQPQLIRRQISNSEQISNVLNIVKVPNQQEIKGYASGKRSVILYDNNKFYRYKGCGNLLEGFTLLNNQPRGCHYFHTLKRELLMTRKINQILHKQIGIQSANQPLFGIQYSQQEILNLGLKCQAQFIGKYCAVFQTQGDRRIGTHLISPLEILYLNLSELSQVNWFELFSNNNRIQDNQPVQFLANWLFLQPGQLFLQNLVKLQPHQNYITLDKAKLNTVSNQKKSVFIESILNTLVKNNEERQYVKNTIFTLKQNFKNAIQAIVQKVGYQMGQIKRIFCDHHINWGYYNDHGALWHCNAHLNNFVSTIPAQNKQFLLPLDFDLAFFEQQFISIDLDESNEKVYGKFDKVQFQNFLCSQYQAMQLSVSGIQVMYNFQYSIENQQNAKVDPLSPIKMAKIVFRDSLLHSFREGMKKNEQKKSEINKKWNQNISTIKQIVKICLTISQDFQT